MLKEGERVSVRFSAREFAEVQEAAGGMSTRLYLSAKLNGILDGYEDWLLASEAPARKYLEEQQAARRSLAKRQLGLVSEDDIDLQCAKWVEFPLSLPKPASTGSKSGRKAALGWDEEKQQPIVRGREAKVTMQTLPYNGLVAIASLLEASAGVGPTARKWILDQPLFQPNQAYGWQRLTTQSQSILTEIARLRTS